MTPEMNDHIRYLRTFVDTTPLVQWSPQPTTITSPNTNIKAWGLISDNGGLIWLQDQQLLGLDISSIREQRTTVDNIQIYLTDIFTGEYEVTPFDTWQGEFGNSFIIDCQLADNHGCEINIPAFTSDIALRLLPINR